MPVSGLGRRSAASAGPLEGWQVASNGLGPLPRRMGSALALSCVAKVAAGEGGRRVNPLERYGEPSNNAEVQSRLPPPHQSSSLDWVQLAAADMSVAVKHCGGGGGGGGGFAQPVTSISFSRKKVCINGRAGGGDGGGGGGGRHESMSLSRAEVWPTGGTTVPLSVTVW